MTKDEFKKVGWTGRMRAMYNGSIFLVATCDFDAYTVGLVKNEIDTPIEVPCEHVDILPYRRVSLRILKAKAQITRRKEEELELKLRCYNPFFQPPTLDTKQVATLGRIMVEIIKQVANSKRTKPFIQRRFKSKHNKSFKDKMIGKSKYQMINSLSDWKKEARERIEEQKI